MHSTACYCLLIRGIPWSCRYGGASTGSRIASSPRSFALTLGCEVVSVSLGDGLNGLTEYC